MPHRNLLRLKTIVSLAFASLASAQAAVWHVSNIAGHPRDFTSVNAAVAAPEVADGDTLIIAGTYGESVTLTRPLHLIGYGYYHTENGISHPPTTQVPAGRRLEESSRQSIGGSRYARRKAGTGAIP